MRMIREHFERDMDKLKKKVLMMGSLVEEAISFSIKALLTRNNELADRVINMDDQIDELQREIEEDAITLIAIQQPMAVDLRFIISAIKIIPELERMADNAVDIAKTVKKIEEPEFIKPLIDIPRMTEKVRNMVRKSIEAYVDIDDVKAGELEKDDDEVDAFHKQIFRELIALMIENPSTISQANYLIFISSYLERIGDRSTNIGEITIYLKTGKYPNLND